ASLGKLCRKIKLAKLDVDFVSDLAFVQTLETTNRLASPRVIGCNQENALVLLFGDISAHGCGNVFVLPRDHKEIRIAVLAGVIGRTSVGRDIDRVTGQDAGHQW